MAAAAGDECISAETIIECSQDNVNFLCPCCAKLKNELERVDSELKSVVEIVKILKEDQHHLSLRVDHIECTTEKKANTETNANSNVLRSTDWKMVSCSKRHANIDTVLPQKFKIPTVVNRYAILESLQEENQVPYYHNINQNPTAKKTKTKARSKTNKVLIIRDSHARGCAANLLREHGEAFEVIGNVMPGAGLQNITQAAKNEIRSLNHKDCVIIWGGSNDINKNESSKGLKHITNFALQNQHTNIIIIPALHRHGLVKSSCIHNEIHTFNRKIGKMTNTMSHVAVPDLTLDREEFTHHGMHLNSTGKEKVAIIIGQYLTDLLTRQENNILTLPWTDDIKDSNSMKETDVTVGVSSSDVIANKVRASERSKKTTGNKI
jgi:hypothetical protein